LPVENLYHNFGDLKGGTFPSPLDAASQQTVIMEIAMKSSDVNTLSPAPAKGLSIALWTTQIVLALLFLFSGVMKFVMPVEEMTKQTSLPGSFFHFIGVVEVLGGLGLVLPSLLRIYPVLTPLAACGLVIVMAGATVTSLPMGLIALFPFVVGILAIFIAYGRFRLLPVQPRR
jgi:uncharacterized membrane protein YphA (DoxX/SURF4 family)